MKTEFNIEQVIRRKRILNELEYERAKVASRRLRVLSKENPELKSTRKKLLDLIYDYENQNWSRDSEISEQKVRENDIAEAIAEKERVFVSKRKELIKAKLKEFQLKQQDLGKILGHKSITHMSELMNGVSAFTLRDLVIISTVLKINLSDLIPKFLYPEEQKVIIHFIKEQGKPWLASAVDEEYALEC